MRPSHLEIGMERLSMGSSADGTGWKLFPFVVYGIAVAAMIMVESKRKS
jgi:hypothetical protein